MEKNILAIDSSLSSTGYAVINFNNEQVLLTGRIHTDSNEDEDNRMFDITNKLITICKLYNIKDGCMEDQYHTVNASTTMKLSRLRGAIAYAFKENNYKLTYMMPSSIRKTFINNSKADKKAIAEEVQKLCINNPYVNLGEFNDNNCFKKNSDMYDAISIGIAYIRMEKKS